MILLAHGISCATEGIGRVEVEVEVELMMNMVNQEVGCVRAVSLSEVVTKQEGSP